jgi:glyoxylase-like metal-dependent hydrolase (beta-lactamase superfamily II)
LFVPNGMPTLPWQAPNAVPVAGRIEVMTNAGDQFSRTPLALEDGQTLELGEFVVEYLWTPHTPHG